MATVIKVDNLSKAYQLGYFGTGTLSNDLKRYWAKTLGKEDPFLKIGEINDRSTKGESDIVWSLKDINFEIEQGDAVGIIGRNGAGKSTLLKILSRITAPTTGSVKIKGRVSSLLEVGTGFHAELSGRENIYLNGAILGMRKKEIDRRFDEIVDFSGVERYIDTPVKRYSSGMYVRLAFAVAAHLESEILIVDEVLAVGDAEFQKKCLGKMNDVTRGQGRTVLFVSHNMGSIQQLCTKGLLLQHGLVKNSGVLKPVITDYLSGNVNNSYFESDEDNTYFKRVAFKDDDGNRAAAFVYNKNINIAFKLRMIETVADLTLSFILKNQYEDNLTSHHFLLTGNKNDEINIEAVIPAGFILPGNYKLEAVLHIPNVLFIEKLPFYLDFRIDDSGSIHSSYVQNNLGHMALPVKWAKV
ncbi:lipopolysaccharide transport system ATP-binding protein [Mucilaginibacter yixingensis]|uniref:Lipopolysaccharide transport system ATP-binding protein n=1 Tax=Mucilaginibacter yixingensis TaxID=1295612 RepID=A0A2T5JFT2_9SPHI|nr:polysaccharide ABC transporter ATP-binding protein [Mucilaginibacter yixingensis]PTR01288.1 lipopolysaccharide transport system ATP-binding protein [Mucilaginibacter yixingensis]